MKHNYIEKKDMSPPLVHCLFSRDQQLLQLACNNNNDVVVGELGRGNNKE